MKNSKLFPFERNKYYYGKLLSVNDFELEQKYMNDKRRIISRLMLGSGVAAGMYVLQVDDFTVSVERGIALDFSGREIVIDDPVIKKLSLIDGYNTYKEIQNNRGYLYLCIEYAEEDTEAVYNVAGSNTAVSGSDYNKIREGFRLFLTDREPENKQLSPTDLYTEKQVIYFGNGIRITQSVPRFAGSGGKVPVKIRVENMGQQQLFAFSYNLALRCMSWEGKSHLKVSFNEAFFERAGSYEMTYTLEAHEVEDAEAFAEIEEDSFRLSVDQRPLNVSVSGRQTTKISGRNVISQLLDSYYQENMENYLKNNFQQSIYLAKISLIQAGESYVIHKVENMPFHQYLYPNELLAAMAELMMTGSSLSAAGFGDEDGRDSARPGEGSDIRMSWGEVEIHLGGKNVRGKRFYSGEIVHGLGIGQAVIQLSQSGDDQTEIFGSSEVFENMDPAVEMAAQLNREKGSFIIGIRPLNETMKESVKIHWTAFKDADEYEEEKKERRIFIKPNVLNLKTRESHYLEAVCSNMKDTRLKWTVKDQGGSIDHNGLYTAPNTTGVFEVTAQSMAYPEVKASIFVVVREASGE